MEEITEYVKIEFDKLDALFAKQEKKFGTEIVPTQCPEHYLNTWTKEAMRMVMNSMVRWLVMVFFVVQFLATSSFFFRAMENSFWSQP